MKYYIKAIHALIKYKPWARQKRDRGNQGVEDEKMMYWIKLVAKRQCRLHWIRTA
ncbi:hypothetical protein YTPLAS21_19250 [Candidatus Nitrosocosmicus sp.]|nr:hypothetical protein YTPLAS21_19250 [Candidatus Nitrosocosmicus sp.]